MPVRIILFLLWISLPAFFKAQAFNRAAFYSAITTENMEEINTELASLEKAGGKGAFKGALLMKKAGLMNASGEKLKLFKEGHKQLETAIAKDSSNAEYRFLRLLIQENAPKIVNYSSAIKKDASYLRQHYKTLPPTVQQALLNYSSRSKELKPGDFKNALHE